MTKETWVQIFVGVEQDGPSSGFLVHQLRTDLVLGCEILHQLVDGKHTIVP